MSAAPNEIPYHNALTRQCYSARNADLLHEAAMFAGHECRAVAGFRQWLELGRVVMRGQHGTKIYMVVDKKDEHQPDATDVHKSKVLKMRTVFFECQTQPLDGATAPIEPSEQTVAPPIAERSTDAQVREILPPTHGLAIAAKFRQMADKLQGAIDRAYADRQENTPKRRREAASQRLEGARLKRTQAALLALAELHDTGAVPPELAAVTTKARVYELVATVWDSSNCGYYDAPRDTGEPRAHTPEAAALWALLRPDPEAAAAEDLRRKVATVRQSGILGFFATPAAVVSRMIEAAQIADGMSILEPSAGDGAIACELTARFPQSIVSVREVNYALCDVLRGRGFDARPTDFLAEQPGSFRFDRILMNPPFERMADVEHVRHAYDFLAPGGRLVSVMSAGPFFRTDRKAQEFGAWLAEFGATVEDLPAESFKSSGTSVAAKLVTIDKP